MKCFLGEVATDLYQRYGAQISELTLLFPSQRARLFFMEALTRLTDKPLWQPHMGSMDALMCEAAGLQRGERLRLLAELYQIFAKHTEGTPYQKESFDKFYFWGEMLLSDFDTIDKYRIDAKQLFANLLNLKELDATFDYLTEEQKQAIKLFWASLGEREIYEEKRRFLQLWERLYPIYEEFRQRLLALGVAYNGLIQRQAVERIECDTFSFDDSRHFVMVGFNALSTCEQYLFKHLKQRGLAHFYWDYDTYYQVNEQQEAGMFIRQNIALLGGEPAPSHEQMNSPKQLYAVATPSNAVQCKYVATILDNLLAEKRARLTEQGKLSAEEIERVTLGKETAIVLTDEQLLLPLLYALPEGLGGVNVTMGYPLKTALIYTFVERLIELQAHARVSQSGECNFYHHDVCGLLSHPYLTEYAGPLSARLQQHIRQNRMIRVAQSLLVGNALYEKIFVVKGDWLSLSDYLIEVLSELASLPRQEREHREFVRVVLEEIIKLRNSIEACGLEIMVGVYTALLRRHLQTLRISFEGEPLEGIQVMGILETRNLDFEHVIILSMDDEHFPGNHLKNASYIPYNLRAAYGLPTPEHHEGVYAYYFYRLIQRAKTVHMLYCSHADKSSTGEPSRYIHQLAYENPQLPLKRIEVGVDVNLPEVAPIQVAKDGAIMQILRSYLGEESQRTFSPTALFRYVECPLKFYFHSIARLSQDDELNEEVDALMFGRILHDAVCYLYTELPSKQMSAELLRAVTPEQIQEAVERSIQKNYLQETSGAALHDSGNLLLIRNIVEQFIQSGILRYDAENPDFELLFAEEKIRGGLPVEIAGEQQAVQFAGVADRVDRLSADTLRVIDYKTGSMDKKMEYWGVENLLSGETRLAGGYIFQTLIYSMLLHRQTGAEVLPALYFVRFMNHGEYAPWIVDKSNHQPLTYSACKEAFESGLRGLLQELYNPEIPFRQCEAGDKACDYCDFKVICKR